MTKNAPSRLRLSVLDQSPIGEGSVQRCGIRSTSLYSPNPRDITAIG
jgi:hypothetical protein